mmetsp:Transcript_21235/g.29755  ORF Transcript_21235/g.29755 Transcript_21235/m.29755 type:complete len:346 (-) Transcript_21235:91-1128(-)
MDSSDQCKSTEIPDCVYGDVGYIEMDKNKNERLYLYARPLSSNDPDTQKCNFVTSPYKTRIRNGRLRSDDLTLDEAGFCLHKFPHHASTSEISQENDEKFKHLSRLDWYQCSDDLIKSHYYPIVENFIRGITGASLAICFNHRLRDGKHCSAISISNLIAEGSPLHPRNSDEQVVAGYAGGAHVDVDERTCDFIFQKVISNNPRAAHSSKGRYMFLNVWRNIDNDNPVINNHLCLVDARSIDPNKDICTTIEFMNDTGKLFQRRLSAKNCASHKWYYYPDVNVHEAIVFKTYDSDDTKTSRSVYHQSFIEDGKPKSTIGLRRSIEVRVLALFPNHIPNTCPPINL